MGRARSAHRRALARKRARHAGRHDDQHGRDARGRRLHRYHPATGGSSARTLHSRDGRRAHERHAGSRGPQCLESGLGRAQSFHHRRRVHGEHRLPEPQHYLHGLDRACLRLRGWPNAAQRALNTERRDFLLAAGLALGTLALPRSGRTAAVRAGFGPIGLQLYTVRKAMQSDFDGTLKRVAAVGYRQVEFAGLFGHPAARVRKVLDQLGLSAPSMHVPFETTSQGWNAVLDDAGRLGCRYVVVPSIPDSMRTSIDDYRRVAESFTRAAEAAAKAGMGFAYHHHAVGFKPLDRKQPFDVLLEATDPAVIRIELDLYWIVRAGYDPLRYFNRW